MKIPGALVLLAIAAAALPGVAQAQGQLAVTAKAVNVRAGPGREYPIVVVVPPGYQIAVQGCLSNYTWCDVIAGPSRGWVYAGNINYPYQNGYVPVLNYGAIIGIGVLAFILDDYWDRHYHDRPWYGQRQRWVHRPPPRYAPPAPPPRAIPPAAPRPGAIGPRPVPRPHDANPSGGVLPGPGAPGHVNPRQRANPPGTVQPGPGAPPPQQPRRDARPPGAFTPGPSAAPSQQGAPRPEHQRAEPGGRSLRAAPGERGRDRGPDPQRP